MKLGKKYPIYDHFLGQDLPHESNYFQEILDEEGNLIGWHCVMANGAGLTGKAQLVGYFPVDTAYEEAEDMAKIEFVDGKTAFNITPGDRGTEGALIGAGGGALAGGAKKNWEWALLGGAIGAAIGYGVGKQIDTWDVEYIE